jgi:hypothetical protein
MLRSSWDVIAERASRSGSALVPTGSYSFKIGGRLYGSGAGLAWRMPSREHEIALTDAPIDWQALFRTVVQIATSDPNRVGALMMGGGLTPAERAILGNLAAAARRTVIAKTISSEVDQESMFRHLVGAWRYVSSSTMVKETQATAAKSTDPESVSRSTGIPYSTLQDAAATLVRKLNIDVPSARLGHLSSDARAWSLPAALHVSKRAIAIAIVIFLAVVFVDLVIPQLSLPVVLVWAAAAILAYATLTLPPLPFLRNYYTMPV